MAKARFDEWTQARADRDVLQTKLDERKTLERAKGILMETRGMTEQEAYRFLQKTSQDKNTPMIDLAKKILLAAPLLQKG